MLLSVSRFMHRGRALYALGSGVSLLNEMISTPLAVSLSQ